MPRSNIYEAGAAGIAELFGDYLECAPPTGSCIALALSARPLGDGARDAIGKSLAALGYGEGAASFATLSPRDPEAEGGDIVLGPQDLFMLVEGLDPLCAIAADEAAVRALESTYRCSFALDSPIRMFGRPAVAFRALEPMLESDAGKQRAWRLFKSLPKRGR